ncbi:hypothetical protein IC617_10195 [Neiella sp. HB171785]|uniref:Uncharacterized protein n=1 Tax=Neiella litorisoli TaxID=2771431 RepID=A0A8J6QUG4_9GAMM|nr:hypothetical protein [Neiella litorisoli]MBD1389797.1 hypothetical protein [Neiella litorisoli]
MTALYWGSKVNLEPFSFLNSHSHKYAIQRLVLLVRSQQAIDIASASDTLNIKAGFTISNNTQYARVDFDNAILNNSLAATGFTTTPPVVSTLMTGWAVGDSYAVIEERASTIQPKTSEFVLPVTSLRWLDVNHPILLQHRLFSAVSDAIIEDELPSVVQEVIFAEKLDPLRESFARYFTHQAAFSNKFKSFKPTIRAPQSFELGDATELLASLGKFSPEQLLAPDVREPTTSEVITDFRDIFPSANFTTKTAVIAGDFSAQATVLNEGEDCLGGNLHWVVLKAMRLM